MNMNIDRLANVLRVSVESIYLSKESDSLFIHFNDMKSFSELFCSIRSCLSLNDLYAYANDFKLGRFNEFTEGDDCFQTTEGRKANFSEVRDNSFCLSFNCNVIYLSMKLIDKYQEHINQKGFGTWRYSLSPK